MRGHRSAPYCDVYDRRKRPLTSTWRYDNLLKERFEKTLQQILCRLLPLTAFPRVRSVLTYDDYCDLPNDRNRYEILDGELSVTPAPSTKHQRISSRLHFVLTQHVLANQLGDVYAAPTDLILAPATVVQPGSSFHWQRSSWHRNRTGHRSGRRLLSSRSSRSQLAAPTAKPRPSSTPSMGCLIIWLVDPDQQSIEAYELVGDQYNPRLQSSRRGAV